MGPNFVFFVSGFAKGAVLTIAMPAQHRDFYRPSAMDEGIVCRPTPKPHSYLFMHLFWGAYISAVSKKQQY